LKSTIAKPAPETAIKSAAWAVHALTASGAVIGLLSLFAVIEGDARQALLWLGVALIVDGIDGPVARRLDVANRLPRFDGALLDLVVDYLTYVVVPAVMMWQFGWLGTGWIAAAAAGWIIFSSLYVFANLDLKTDDNYFVGFPAIWNVVALFMFVLEPDPWLNIVAVAVLGAFSFTKVKSAHPLRVRDFRAVTLGMAALWVGTSFGLIWLSPGQPDLLLWGWLAANAWFVGLSFWRSFR